MIYPRKIRLEDLEEDPNDLWTCWFCGAETTGDFCPECNISKEDADERENE